MKAPMAARIHPMPAVNRMKGSSSDGDQKRAQGQSAGDDENEHEQQQEIDAQLEQRGADQHPAQYVDREDDLGHVGLVLAYEVGRARHHFHEEAEHDRDPMKKISGTS